MNWNNTLGMEVKKRLEDISDIKTISVTVKEKAEYAELKANEAIDIAEESKNKSTNTQQQLDQIVIDGDSSVEAAQARVNESGYEFDTLRDRLNDSDNTIKNIENDILNIGDTTISYLEDGKVSEVEGPNVTTSMEYDGEEITKVVEQRGSTTIETSFVYQDNELIGINREVI
jgi:uncharacterized phage infection (PIP) family protein YhgE